MDGRHVWPMMMCQRSTKQIDVTKKGGGLTRVAQDDAYPLSQCPMQISQLPRQSQCPRLSVTTPKVGTCIPMQVRRSQGGYMDINAVSQNLVQVHKSPGTYATPDASTQITMQGTYP
jgi:hypothetical protein